MQESWRLYNKKADFAGIAQQFQIPEPLAVILCNRGIDTPEAIRKYLYGTLEDLYDPFLMKGMKEGVSLTADTIRKNEKILIVGDYDADGVCSAYILESFLQKAGARTSVRIPDRMKEGYGFQVSMAQQAAKDGFSLLITCDNGISAFEAVKCAEELGIRVIVTDHHEPSDILPYADVIIDPKQPGCAYPFRDLCGAGVAYRFMQALNTCMELHMEEELIKLLPFAAIATIADVVPLRDENRILAAEGLKVLRGTEHYGLSALVQVRSLILSAIRSEDISFNLAPCINSAGRLKSADLVLQLFRAGTMDEALFYARQLSALNEERKEMTTALIGQVLPRMQEKEQTELPMILVLYLPDAHESLAGLIAGKLMDRYYRPVLVITGKDGSLKGSGRSTPRYDIIAAIRSHEELFEKCGGHKQACGFTLKQMGSPEETVEHLDHVLNNACTMTAKDLQRKVWVDLALPFAFLNETFIDQLELLEPYGAENEKPIFGVLGASVSDCEVFGRNRNALRVRMTDRDGYFAEGIMFGNEAELRGRYEELLTSRRASVLFQLSMNEYRGRRSPRMTIRGLKITEG